MVKTAFLQEKPCFVGSMADCRVNLFIGSNAGVLCCSTTSTDWVFTDPLTACAVLISPMFQSCHTLVSDYVNLIYKNANAKQNEGAVIALTNSFMVAASQLYATCRNCYQIIHGILISVDLVRQNAKNSIFKEIICNSSNFSEVLTYRWLFSGRLTSQTHVC